MTLEADSGQILQPEFSIPKRILSCPTITKGSQWRKGVFLSPLVPNSVSKTHRHLKSMQVLQFLAGCFADRHQEAEFILVEEAGALSRAGSCAQDLSRMWSFVYTAKSNTILGGEATVAAGFLFQLWPLRL